MKTPLFEELDYRETPIGALALRRRRQMSDGEDIYEIKLNDGYLMSSLITAGEVALAVKALEKVGDRKVNGVVGGLGLGYTAKAALDHSLIQSLVVIEAIPEVIEWHERQLLPLGRALTSDSRCKLVCGNFFEMASAGGNFDPDNPDRRFDVVMVDIDHSPRHLLAEENASFYEYGGLIALSDALNPTGIFALWSTDPPDQEFLERLEAVFESATAEIIQFENPFRPGTARNTVYLAVKE